MNTMINSKEDRIAERKLLLENELNRIVSVLIEKYDPLKIILFGSLATGNIHDFSDIDLIVIKNSKKPFFERLEEVILLTMPKVGTDILVYTPEEFKSIQDRLFIKEEVIKKGRVIYSNWFDFTNDDIESAEILLKHHNKPQKRLLKAFW